MEYIHFFIVIIFVCVFLLEKGAGLVNTQNFPLIPNAQSESKFDNMVEVFLLHFYRMRVKRSMLYFSYTVSGVNHHKLFLFKLVKDVL